MSSANILYTKRMKLSQLIFTIASVIIAVWLLGLIFKFAAWLISGLLYVAAIVVAIGLVMAYIESRKRR